MIFVVNWIRQKEGPPRRLGSPSRSGILMRYHRRNTMIHHILCPASTQPPYRRKRPAIRPDPEGEPRMDIGRRGAYAAARLPTTALAERRFERVPVRMLQFFLPAGVVFTRRKRTPLCELLTTRWRRLAFLLNLFWHGDQTTLRTADCAID